jgi:L-alanine-DL-glutamate epimerase-like enolase superfamily enzyme
MFEFMELDHPLIHIFKDGMPRPREGKIELPDKPGLGVELDRKAIEKWVEK